MLENALVKVPIGLLIYIYVKLIYVLMKKVKIFFTALLALVASAAFAQNITVTGDVMDSSNSEPVAFASIQLKGTMTGATSDANGHYSISVPADGILIFSSIGYKTVEVKVAGKSVQNVTLEPDAEFIDETIVVAYGTATKSSFTGSAAMVKSETIAAHVASNVTTALAGTTPGVQMISSSGDPASNGSSIRIRGIGSMSASSAPLYILDGMPYEGTISDINPNDVESISVLKDAAASAIYGARGANGVVLITTKKASAQSVNVKFDAKWGSNSRLIPQYDVIRDPGEYYETWYKLMYNSQIYNGKTSAEAYAYADANLFNQNNGGLGYQVFTVPDGQKLIGTNFKLNPNAELGYDDGEYYYTPDDWYNEAFHSSFRHEYNLSTSGSKGGLTYYASAGYLNDGGIINNSGYERYTARINADYQAKKWLKFTTSMGYSHSKSSSPGTYSYGSSGNLFYVANTIGPIYPLYVRATGTHEIMSEQGRTVYDANQTNFKRPGIVGNAVRDNEVNRKTNYADVLTGKWGVVVTPVKGLDLSANVGLFNDNTRYNALYSQFGSSASTDGSVYVSHSRKFAVNTQYLATYKTDFGGTNHHLDALVGFEMYKNKTQALSGENTHLFNPFVGELNNADGKSDIAASSSTSDYMTEGILSRLQYDYAGKYFVSASYRRDASSNFAKGHRWGNFGSVGLGWLISKENFMSDASWVNFLKLKASYGVQGNDSIGSFRYIDQYTHSYNEETGEYSLTLYRKGNENLTWESSHSFNVGVDFELFGGYLNGGIEFFDRITSDLLYSKNVPLSSGNPTGVIPMNVGSIDNIGVEVNLNGDIIRTKHVNWNWNLNLSHYKNTILSLDESVSEEGIKGSNYIYRIGGSLYDSYVIKYAGVNEEGKGLYYVKTKDENGKWTGETTTTTDITKADQFECGTTLPKVYGGFGTSLSAYGFDFSIQLSFQLGGKYYDGTYQSMMLTQASNSAGNNIHRDILNAWTPENTNTSVPRLDGDSTVGQTAVDRFFVSSNYLSVNNVTLGYTFPKKWMDKIRVGSIRIYVAGENLAVATARKGVDPRYSMGIGSFTSGSGLNSGAYSAMRNISGGLTLTF